MLDIKFIRSNATLVQEVCNSRNVKFDVQQLLAVDRQRTKLLGEVEIIRGAANKAAASVRGASDLEREELLREGAQLKREVKVVEELLAVLDAQWTALQKQVPNLVDASVPLGETEASNVEIEVYGQRPSYDFEAKDHIQLAQKFGLDFDAGVRIAGTGFPLMRGKLARMEQALLRFAVDRAISAGFELVNVPLLAKTSTLEGLGFNPRREDAGTEVFSTIQDNLCLAGTAEIPLVGQFGDQVVEFSSGPIQLVAMTPCFRREGAAGRRDAGLYRNKMFWKAELVVLTTPEQSTSTLERIRDFEVGLFRELGLHFRVINIASGDLGAPAFKKYDLEAWMMGRNSSDSSLSDWGEVTSCSNCTDYQSRRLNIRYRAENGKLAFVHTLNGTGVTTRALIPILEQYQRQDGSVVVPEPLRKYTGFDVM